MEQKEAKDELYEQHPYGIKNVRQKLEPHHKYAGADVLVAGCGAGSRLFDLLFAGANVTGVDQSQEAIKYIEDQATELGYSPELIVGDLVDIDLPPDSFDFVFCMGVLHHTVAPEQVLENLRIACKDDGELEVLVYNENSPVRAERQLIEKFNKCTHVGSIMSEDHKQTLEWWDKYENPIWDTYTSAELKSLLESSGYEVQDLWFSGPLFGQFINMVLPQIIEIIAKKYWNEKRWHICAQASPL